MAARVSNVNAAGSPRRVRPCGGQDARPPHSQDGCAYLSRRRSNPRIKFQHGRPKNASGRP